MNELMGFIDLRGETVLPPLFYTVGNFKDGLSLVEAEKEIGYIDRTGAFVWSGPLVEIDVSR